MPRSVGDYRGKAIWSGCHTGDAWLAKHVAPVSEAALAGASAYIELVERAGGEADVAKQQGSIYAGFTGVSGRKFYPFHLWADGHLVSLSLRWLQNRPALSEVAARQAWYDRFVDIVGPTTTSNLSGFPSFNVELLANKQKALDLGAYLVDIVEFIRSERAG